MEMPILSSQDLAEDTIKFFEKFLEPLLIIFKDSVDTITVRYREALGNYENNIKMWKEYIK